MAASLQSLTLAIQMDPGLLASIPTAQLNLGLAASRSLNDVLLRMIDQSGVNADGLISAQDMKVISDTIWKPENAQAWRDFWTGHGNDSGTNTSGFHWVQNDGGTLQFRGRAFVDTVADAIYHYGFEVRNGRYYNEDGNDNETLIDTAGWLNYFLNGRSVIWGTDATESLGSGTYSGRFADARNETFYAGGGNDSIWADIGNDKVYGGNGQDMSGGGLGNDTICGEAGNDTLWGDEGSDSLVGGLGNDDLGGSDGSDTLVGQDGNDDMGGGDGRDMLVGGIGNDSLSGDIDADRLLGDAGNDAISGGDGIDLIFGGIGNDVISAGNGADVVNGGAGKDVISLWESAHAHDQIVFNPGDSGRSVDSIDRIEGFISGQDKIDLSAFDGMSLAKLDFRGGGRASCYYDGQYLRLDVDGDRATDMMIKFMWLDSLAAGDFIFASS